MYKNVNAAMFFMIVCLPILFHVFYIDASQKTDTKIIHRKELKECPCSQCRTTIFPRINHPYTDKEKNLTKVLLKLYPSLFIPSGVKDDENQFPILLLILGYYFGEEEQEWIKIGSLKGLFSLPEKMMRACSEKPSPFYLMHHIDFDFQGMESVSEKVLLIQDGVQFSDDDLKKIKYFFDEPDIVEPSCTITSLNRDKKITAFIYGNITKVKHFYALDHVSRVQSLMRKKIEKKSQCAIL